MVQTVVDALSALPRGQARGFRFLTLEGEEHYYPFEVMEREARRRAARLAERGLKKGDRLALVISEPEDFVLSFLGAVVAGVVPVPMYSRASFSFKTKKSYQETISHVIQASGSRLLIADEDSKPIIDEVAQGHAELEDVVAPRAFFAGEPPPHDPPEVGPDDLCFLQFTSGSTAMPKGVMVTHGNLVANAQAIFGPRGLGRHEDDVHLCWLPLYHDMGLIGFVLGPIVCDLPTVLLPTASFARRPSLWMEAMSKYRGTMTFGPNFGYALAARRTRDQDLEKLDLRHVRIAGCGAEPINPDVLRKFCARFAPVGFRPEAFLPAYGLAESTLATTFHPRGTPTVTDIVDAKALARGEAVPAAAKTAETVELVSCGVPFPGHEVKIVDADGNPLPERRVGEIVAFGPSVTTGYFKETEATARAYRDGWLYTGDLGYLADGNLYVCGRSKDLIIINGINYYPQDIEWAIADVPGLRPHSVVAFSVLRDGEETLIVCVEGTSTAAAEIRRAVATKLGETTGLRVGHVAVVPAGTLPLTSSGKVQRQKTKQLFQSGQLAEHAT